MHLTWAKRGIQPKVPITGQRKSVKIFGCVDAVSARFLYRRDTVFNADTYLNFLEQIAKRYYKKHIFYIQDNASYHKDSDVWLWFKDHKKWIEVINLPPYSPEFNATERLWQHTRKHGTHNRCFHSETEVYDAISSVFRSIQRKPEQIAGYLRPFL